MAQADLRTIRASIEKHIGSKVRVSANKGRQKIVVSEGVITKTYPSIFTIEMTDEKVPGERTVTFSYQDVVTQDVRMILL